MENLGRCINKGGTLEEEIATDRKFEFIQVLQRKLTESSEQPEWVNIMEAILNMAAGLRQQS